MTVKTELLAGSGARAPRRCGPREQHLLSRPARDVGCARASQPLRGMHFFNPPHRNPLVELIRTPATDDTTVSYPGRIVATLDKVGVPAGIGDGFVANRVYADYRTQAEFLVEEGASPSDVDARCADSACRSVPSPSPTCPASTSPGRAASGWRDARSAATLRRDSRPALRNGPPRGENPSGVVHLPCRLAARGTRPRGRRDHRGRTCTQGRRATPDRRCRDPATGCSPRCCARRRCCWNPEQPPAPPTSMWP